MFEPLWHLNGVMSVRVRESGSRYWGIAQVRHRNDGLCSNPPERDRRLAPTKKIPAAQRSATENPWSERVGRSASTRQGHAAARPACGYRLRWPVPPGWRPLRRLAILVRERPVRSPHTACPSTCRHYRPASPASTTLYTDGVDELGHRRLGRRGVPAIGSYERSAAPRATE